MLRSLARRERRPLWGAFTFILVVAIGLGVWATMNARAEATAEAGADAELAAQTELAPLLSPRDLASQITGDRAAELAAGIERSITSVSPIDHVRIFSPLGRILYAEDPRFVGTRPSYLRNLTFEVSSGKAQSVVRDGQLQTYVPLWSSPGGDVVVAELSQPVGPIGAEAAAGWVRILLVVGGLALGCLAMVVVTSRAPVTRPMSVQVYTPATPRRMPHDVQPLAGDGPIYAHAGFRSIEEQRQEAERRASAVEENFRVVQKRLKDALAQVKELEGRLALSQTQSSTNDGDLGALREQLRETAERLHRADLENNALRERMVLRQQELDEARRLLTEARAQGGADGLRPRLEVALERAAALERQVDELQTELERATTKLHMTKFSEALREFDNDGVEIEEEDDLFEHPVIIRNTPGQTTPQRVS
jgi:hypothetical protein